MTMEKYKVCKDGFVWLVIEPEEARELFGQTEVFALYDDDAESAVERAEDITDDCQFGIEVGFIDSLKPMTI